MTATSRFIAELQALAKKANPGPYYIEVDGWPYRPHMMRQGSVPYWSTGEESDPATNPYHPNTVSFDTLELTARLDPTTLRLLLDIVEKTLPGGNWMELRSAQMALEDHLEEGEK